MSLRRTLLIGIAVALCAFAGWLPFNLAYQGAFDKAIYGAIWGAAGTLYGFLVARYWAKVNRTALCSSESPSGAVCALIRGHTCDHMTASASSVWGNPQSLPIRWRSEPRS